MAELTDVELDERLSELEQDLGPTLRAAYRGSAIRAVFTAQARASVFSTESATGRRRPALRIVHLRSWAALAAMLVGILVVAGAVLANQPQPVSAAAVLEQLEAEAYGAMVQGEGPCPGPGATGAAGGSLVIQTGGPGVGDSGPVTVSNTNANELSERLAKALGVSGDRVRQAMIATVRGDLAAAPEPMSTIAQQLGKTPAEVCAAFFDGQVAGEVGLVVSSTSTTQGTGRPGPHTEARFNVGGKAIDLNSATADELSGPAHRLGVSPESLLAAVRAAVPSTPPPPPGEAEIISRLASNLGMSEDKVRAAIKQVEGNGPFYFVVPLPSLGR
jgi:hypothetical protein